MTLSLVDAGEPVAPQPLAEWRGTLTPDERSQIRALAQALAKDEAAAVELEIWLVLGHAAAHAWACAEREVAELKQLLACERVPRGRA